MEQRKNYTGYGQRTNNYSNQNREQEIHKIEKPLHIYYADKSKLFLPDGKAYKIALSFKGITTHQLRKILNQYGYRVPEDIQLIGFDGMNLSSDLPLGISTIAQPVEQLANGAVDLVLRKIVDPSLKNEAKMYPVRYVDGNTTK